MVSSIRRANVIAGSKKPLLVFIAGNKPIDAYWNGFGALVDTFPQQVLVVGSSDSSRALSSFSGLGSNVEIVAPGSNVATMSGTGTIVRASGTSLSAPLVSGTAGLLLSFDSTLTAADLKALVIAGAQAGGRLAGGIPVLNAYESLKKAAERTGAPLCGNHVWAIEDSLFVTRGAASERIAVRPGSGSSGTYTYHGGHFIDFNGGLRWANSNWTPGAIPPDAVPSGSGSSASGGSHDGDTLVFVTQTSPIPNPIVSIQITDSAGTRTIATINGVLNLHNPWVAFPVMGDEVIANTWSGIPADFRADIWAVNISTGAVRNLITYPSPAFVQTISISEDGKSFAIAYVTSALTADCKIEFRSVANAQLLRPAIVAPSCNFGRGMPNPGRRRLAAGNH
jgi:hypothetical protein